MIPSYYLLKIFRKSRQERTQRNYSDIELQSTETNNSQTKIKEEFKCRICLKGGNIPIYDDDNLSNLAAEVSKFGEIEISKDDKYPKHLCETCYNLLEGAILFRKTAKITNEILTKAHKTIDCHENRMIKSHIVDNIKEQTKCTSSLFHKYFSVISNENEVSEGKSNSLHTRTKKISKVQCKICFKIITKAYYKEHFALHDSAIAKYMCDICGKSFRQRCSYRNHYFTHSTDFPYKCKLCPYRGRHSSLLKTHMRTHSGDYRYMCTECPARFLTKSNLNKHTLKHKEPTFKCDSCKRAFHTKLILERHFEADHLGIKNHVCNVCGKAFGYRKAMMRHQLDVHKREKKLNGRTPAYLEAEFINQMKF